MPPIAVVMPVFNRADTVHRAISSVLRQSFSDFELIIVDDGSSDRSAEIVGSIVDPRIRFIRFDSNRGGNSARNAGIRASSAPLIAFLDSDDAFLPQKLEMVVGIFAARSELDLLVDSFVHVFPPGDGRGRLVRQNKRIDDQDMFVRALFTRRLRKGASGITVRREAALTAGLFDESLKRMQDFDFLIRAAAVGRCAATDDILWEKYWLPESITAGDTWMRANIELCRRHPQFLSNSRLRPGLAYGVGRSIKRQFARRRFGAAVADVRRLAAAFGWRQTMALLVESRKGRPRL